MVVKLSLYLMFCSNVVSKLHFEKLENCLKNYECMKRKAKTFIMLKNL